MKLWGIISVVLADLMYIFYIKSKKHTELKNIHDLILFIQYVNVNVLERKMTLYNSVIDTKEKVSSYIDGFVEFFCNTAYILNVRKSLVKAIDVYFSDTDEKIRANIKEYLLILGNTDKKTSMDYYRVMYDECEKIFTNKKEELEKSIKIISVLTYGLSSMAILVLI